MPALSFLEARTCVLDTVRRLRPRPAIETVSLGEAADRILAEPVIADRDYPATARSVRDGFAVRSSDLPGAFQLIGEVRAGSTFLETLAQRQAVEIMTGAPVPAGADQIVMVEHASRMNGTVRTARPAAPGEFINAQGCEARKGAEALRPGTRIGFAQTALLATFGYSEVKVFARPRVAILATGDEIVDVHETPREDQVRNSNAMSLAAQVKRAGGSPEILPVARDNADATRELIASGLTRDLLLLSGGVSAGKYDLVETVLAGLGAEFYFDQVSIQPGKPLVFGRALDTFFFGLPGNPGSTMVTFEVFARAAVELLSGLAEPVLPVMPATLTRDFRHRPGLTRFLPATLGVDGREVTPIAWQGSSDVPSLARANCFLVADADRESWASGETIGVLRT